MNRLSPLTKAALWIAAVLLSISQSVTGEEIKPLAQYDTHHKLLTMSLSPDGHRLALVDRDAASNVILLEWPSCREIVRVASPSDKLIQLTFDPTGEKLAAISMDRHLYLWEKVNTNNPQRIEIPNLENKKKSFWSLTSIYRQRSQTNSDRFDACALYPRKNVLILAGQDKKIRFLDFSEPNQAKEIKTLDTSPDEVRGLVLSPDGRLLISMATYQSLKLWDVQDPQNTRLLYGLAKEPFKPWGNVIFSQDSKIVAYAGFKPSGTEPEGAVILFDVSNPTLPQELSLLSCHRDSAHSIAISPDGKWVAAGFINGTVSVWDISNRFQARLAQSFKPQNEPAPVLFSPENTLLTLGYDGVLKEWPLSFNSPAAQKMVPNLKPGDVAMRQLIISLAFVDYPGIPYLRKMTHISSDNKLTEEQALKALNFVLDTPDFYKAVDDKRIPILPFSIHELLAKAKRNERLSQSEIRQLNKGLLIGTLGRQTFPNWKENNGG